MPPYAYHCLCTSLRKGGVKRKTQIRKPQKKKKHKGLVYNPQTHRPPTYYIPSVSFSSCLRACHESETLFSGRNRGEEFAALRLVPRPPPPFAIHRETVPGHYLLLTWIGIRSDQTTVPSRHQITPSKPPSFPPFSPSPPPHYRPARPSPPKPAPTP